MSITLNSEMQSLYAISEELSGQIECALAN